MNPEQFKGDKIIWIIAILLSVFSLLVVYSSTGSIAPPKNHGFFNSYLFKQLVLVILGFGLMYATYRVPYTYFSRFAQFLFIISIPLMLYVAFFGVLDNGARRAIFLPGLGLTFQPGDLAKLALIMFIARLLAHKHEMIQDLKKGFLPVVFWILLMCVLFISGGLSTTLIVFFTSVVMLYMGRARIKHLLALLAVGLAGFLLLLAIESTMNTKLTRHKTWENRITDFFNPINDSTTQVAQSKIAIASGGFFGKMPGNSTQRIFLKHAYSDYVYAIIIEEYGLAGGAIIVFLFLILMFRALKIARKTDKKFGSFLVIGVSFMLVIQAVMNMGVAVDLFPVTGQNLPLISLGGTSFLFTCFGIGMILSVSRSIPESQNSSENLNYVAS